MQPFYKVPIWRKAPFTRLLLPLVTAILLQSAFQISLIVIASGLLVIGLAYLGFHFLSLKVKYRLFFLQGFLINLLVLFVGMAITWQQNIQHHPEWYGSNYLENDWLVVRVTEPLIPKAKSYKINGEVEVIIRKNKTINCRGNILVYLLKDSSMPVVPLQYGDKLITRKKLQPIKNQGNPGAFNHQRYAAFQQLFHQVFLKGNEWAQLPGSNPGYFQGFIFNTREYVLKVLRKNVGSNKDELGIAEALLIGYTNDLDKDLLQAYSNTGVVHIIAISGMHLGLIYFLLVGLCKHIPLLKNYPLLTILLILSGLWLFSILTGAAASVLRAAVMFTFITIGTHFKKRSAIFNSLASAAFLLLCYDPNFLWDVGFQLSFLAVISIVIFQRPIYNCIYLKNKWADQVWKLAAVSLAAQVLTFPVCIYYFHQFPNLFLLANMLAVPLSGLVLYFEIALVLFSRVPFAAAFVGKIVEGLLWLMNSIIYRINEIPFAVWDHIAATPYTTFLVYGVVIALGNWWLNKNKQAFQLALFFLVGFSLLQAYGSWQICRQQKIIVYNVPQHQAIDVIEGNQFYFIGDSSLQQEGMLQNFHLKPARILFQAIPSQLPLQQLIQWQNAFQFGNKRILLVDQRFHFNHPPVKIPIDYIILSKNPNLQIAQLASIFDAGCYVFDASNSLWKIDKWKKECEELHLRSYSVPESGAFVVDVGK